MTSAPPDDHPLIALLGLEEGARRARTVPQLAFLMVNDAHAVAPYRQAALFIAGRGIVALSGVATPEPGAPYVLWLRRLVAGLEQTSGGPRPLTAADLPPALASGWTDWLPAHALWLPLADGDGQPLGGLLYARDEPWDEGALLLLGRAAGFFGFAWAARHRPTWGQSLRRRVSRVPRWRWLAAAVGLAVLALPVRLSVLAPAEVVARDPAVIRAPLDGVVEAVAVRPNQPVAAGQVLFTLDRTTVAGKLAVADKGLSTALAELDLATQQAFLDPKAKAQLATLKARAEEKAAELAELRDLLARTEARAPRAGVAVMDDPSAWIGRPVAVGEKVLAIADPAQVEVEGWLAAADLIALEPGSPVTLFLNTDPLAPVAASLAWIGFEAQARPDGAVAYRVRAALAPQQAPPRLGLKGTARLDGARVPLALWLFRRPLAVVRQVVGW